jgi:6-phosphofructokinase 2
MRTSPRIVTLTLNPAVDLACMAPAVRPTHKIRAFDERFDPGGGGINVSRVIHILGGQTLGLVMTGGETGHLLAELLDEAGVPWQRIRIRGRNRVSVNVHDQQSGLEYRFVPEGPTVQPDEWAAALGLLETVEADWIVASGSLPRGVPVDFYVRAAAIAARRGQHFVVDTSGVGLKAAAADGVTMLKVSLGELEFLVGRPLEHVASQDLAVTGLLRSGSAKMIAVSLGEDGALLATRNGIIRLAAIPVQARGAVGAGDSFLAGLVLGLARGLTDRLALAFGMAAGAAAVTTYGTAQVRRDDVEALYRTWCEKDAAAAGV